MMIEIVKMPLAPTPVKERPAINTSNVFAILLTRHPTASTMVETKIHIRGPKTDASFPFNGARAEMAIRYAEVNHVVFSKASSSLAISLCVVVRREMLVAWRKMRKPRAVAQRVPRAKLMVWLAVVWPSSGVDVGGLPSWSEPRAASGEAVEVPGGATGRRGLRSEGDGDRESLNMLLVDIVEIYWLSPSRLLCCDEVVGSSFRLRSSICKNLFSFRLLFSMNLDPLQRRGALQVRLRSVISDP